MKSLNNSRLGGLLILIAVVLFLITVYLEHQIGWIGSPRSQDPAFVPNFIKNNWGELKSIWGWQVLANFLFTWGYFHLTNISRPIFWIPLGSLWAVLFILSLLTLVSFGITLGAYEAALSVHDSNPTLFTTIRGAVLGLYSFGGGIGQFVLFLILIFETFSKNGVVPRLLGITVIALLLISFASIMLNVFPGKVVGLIFFIMPLTLGYSYLWHSAHPEKSQIPEL